MQGGEGVEQAMQAMPYPLPPLSSVPAAEGWGGERRGQGVLWALSVQLLAFPQSSLHQPWPGGGTDNIKGGWSDPHGGFPLPAASTALL